MKYNLKASDNKVKGGAYAVAYYFRIEKQFIKTI